MKTLLVITFIFVLNISFAQDMDPQKNDPNMKKVKTRALKVEFFSPLTGNLTLGYEHYVKGGRSWETKLGIIGAGQDLEGQGGVFVKVGPKFKLTPDYLVDGMRSSHPLRGSYIKPELVVNYFSIDGYNEFGKSTRESQSGFAFLINFGKQFVLGQKITIDWSLGVGYGVTGDGYGGYQYGVAIGDSTVPVAVSSGFTLGILL